MRRRGADHPSATRAISLYAENSAAAQAYWAGGVLDTYVFNGILDLAWFRVLELGTLYDNGNG